jgi:hypothetical protein
LLDVNLCYIYSIEFNRTSFSFNDSGESIAKEKILEVLKKAKLDEIILKKSKEEKEKEAEAKKELEKEKE